MKNTEISVDTAKEEGGEMGSELKDGSSSTSNIYMRGGKNLKKIKQFIKVVFIK